MDALLSQPWPGFSFPCVALPFLDRINALQIDHAVAIAGIDHVGLASHAQSIPQWKEYTEALIEHGYPEKDAERIMGGNVVRVLSQH